MANALAWINKRVKDLQKKQPKAKRATLQKQAGREWKSKGPKKRIPVARQKAGRKRSTRQVSGVSTSPTTGKAVGSVQSLKSAIVKKVKGQLSAALVTRELAKPGKAKKKAAKRVAAIKAQIRKYL